MQPKSKESNSKAKKDQKDTTSKEFPKNVNLFETTYEKVLSIINQVKDFIKKTSKTSQKLIDDLEWVIKVITNKSLYSYEVSKAKNIKRNSEVNRLINFMTQYNDEILEMNKRHILVSSIFNIMKKGDVLLKPSLILKKIHPDELKHMDFQKEKEIKERKKKSIHIIGNIFLNLYYKGLEQQKKEKEEKEKAEKEKVEKEKVEKLEKEKAEKDKKDENDKKNKKNSSAKIEKLEKIPKIREEKRENVKIEVDLSKKFKKIIKKESRSKPKIPHKNISKNNSISINTPQKTAIKKINTSKFGLNKISINDSDKKRSIALRKKIKNKSNDSNTFINSRKDNNNKTQILNKKLTLTSIKKAMQNYYCTHKDLLDNIKRPNKSINVEKEFPKDKKTKTNYLSESYLNNNQKPIEINKRPNYRKINNNISKNNNNAQKKEEKLTISSLIDKYSNDIRDVTDKDFDIFDFKKKVGYKNVLPMIGHVLLKTLGLIDSRIISISKLSSFLYTVSESYLETTLYHNAMHGADVAQSLCIFFISSNAEQISESTVLDLLGMIISAMGHDLGHPGYNNNFHINALSDLALTYNDASCLENFHTSYLFKILKKEENNIFEKFNTQNFKSIRKRMISQILATDMANHGEVVSLIRAKIKACEEEEEEGDVNFELLSGNEKSKFDEQQMLFNYLIHAADLGHNCKKFEISLQWVEVLCEEFWKQGDMEKKKGIPVSFLCDRDKIDVPTSQIGFLRGFIVTTFDCLAAMFPSLKYTMENAENNIKQWQNLRDKNRIRGWTPKKEEKEEKKKN